MMTDSSLSERIFDGIDAKSDFSHALWEAGARFEKLGFDDYDCSVELYGVATGHRLPEDAQRVISDAGFMIAFVNHEDKWETHYTFGADCEFPVKGWRISYPDKRGENAGSIWVEEVFPTWPKDWFETGYAIVKGPQS